LSNTFENNPSDKLSQSTSSLLGVLLINMLFIGRLTAHGPIFGCDKVLKLPLMQISIETYRTCVRVLGVC
jgi:hypothetical protein